MTIVKVDITDWMRAGGFMYTKYSPRKITNIQWLKELQKEFKAKGIDTTINSEQRKYSDEEYTYFNLSREMEEGWEMKSDR